MSISYISQGFCWDWTMSVDHLKKHQIEQETQAERQLQQVGKNCEEELPIYGAHLLHFIDRLGSHTDIAHNYARFHIQHNLLANCFDNLDK